jgi:hypothetical protein
LKPYHRNPRQISKKDYERLTDTLTRLGDLSGIVHNLNTDEVIGGNQRMTVFTDGTPEIVETYDKPDEQGTIAHGFIVWKGHKFAYRQVKWNEATAAEANIAANLGGGDWNWEVLANEWDASSLIEWGMDGETIRDWKRDITALDTMIGVETIEHDMEGTKSGASPWDRMNGDSANGVLFQFGAITCRLTQETYDKFLEACPEQGINQFLTDVLLK